MSPLNDQTASFDPSLSPDPFKGTLKGALKGALKAPLRLELPGVLMRLLLVGLARRARLEAGSHQCESPHRVLGFRD